MIRAASAFSREVSFLEVFIFDLSFFWPAPLGLNTPVCNAVVAERRVAWV
jgi:hypothetical protein